MFEVGDKVIKAGTKVRIKSGVLHDRVGTVIGIDYRGAFDYGVEIEKATTKDPFWFFKGELEVIG